MVSAVGVEPWGVPDGQGLYDASPGWKGERSMTLQNWREVLALIAGGVIDLWILGMGIAILYLIYTGKINLSRLISEPNGDASMSRFQLLIFTLVIALSLFVVVASAEPAGFPD